MIYHLPNDVPYNDSIYFHCCTPYSCAPLLRISGNLHFLFYTTRRNVHIEDSYNIAEVLAYIPLLIHYANLIVLAVLVGRSFQMSLCMYPFLSGHHFSLSSLFAHQLLLALLNATSVDPFFHALIVLLRTTRFTLL